MTSPPVSAYPQFSKTSVVETYDSSFAIVALPAQEAEDRKMHPMQFPKSPRRTVTVVEEQYIDCEREELEVIFTLRNMAFPTF